MFVMILFEIAIIRKPPKMTLLGDMEIHNTNAQY